MNRAVLLTKADPLFMGHVLTELLEQGCTTAMVFPNPEEAEACMDRMPARYRERFFPLWGTPADETGIRALVDQAASRMGRLDVLIHGVEARDEEAGYNLDPLEFGLNTAAELRTRFLYSRAVAAHMARAKSGQIWFLLLMDSLYYNGYPSSPVLNQGTLGLMKTLAKELSPFRVAVNAVTYGYYAFQDERVDKKELKQRLEIHALKPYLPGPQEMAAASVDWLLRAPERLVSGQNLHFGAGLDTSV
jgi:NAD(P)-dependent dehydrogenase (short-subunit alcohol dehydrogenase family)